MNKKTTVRPKSSRVNKIGQKVYDSLGQMKRENILKSFTPEFLRKVWAQFCNFIAQNYESGRGTMVKGFGTFTFTGAEISLEGTTNQYQRDNKIRYPVFIVSKEFNENLRPGQFNPTGGLLYYNQKQNNSISHVRMNYAELSYALNITKDECYLILTNIIGYLADSIRKNEFKNKEMPYIGLLMLRGNILGIKFNENLVNLSKKVPQKLLHTKKNIQLYMEPEENKEIIVRDIPDIKKTMNALRPKTSVITKITDTGEKWLKNNLDIDLEKEFQDNNNNNNGFQEEQIDADQGENFEEDNKPLDFINDNVQKKKSKNKKNLFSENDAILSDLNISNEILESIQYNKSVLVYEMKKFDRRNTGRIQMNDCITAFINANVHPGLNNQLICDIIKIYSENVDNIDYMKLITCLIKDIKKIIGDISVNTLTKNPLKEKGKMRPMSGYCPSNVPNINYNKQKVDLKEVEKEIKVIKVFLEDLFYKYRTRAEQKISINELKNILKEYSIVYPLSKIEKILRFIEINNIKSFTLTEFYNKMKNCKILSSEITQSDMKDTLNKLKDLIYVAGGENFLFNNKNEISFNEFCELLLYKTKFSEDCLKSVFYFITKSERNLTREDYKKYFVNDERVMDEDFDIMAMRQINQKIESCQIKSDEYFSHLLSYNVSRKDNTINRVDFHRVCLIEKLKFSAQEVDHIFDLIDKKKDGVIDRLEFNNAVNRVHRALFQVQDIIKKNNLEIEDIAYRLEIDKNKPELLDYYGFKGKMRKLDYTFNDNFIQELFSEMNHGESYVHSDDLLDQLNVYHKIHFRNMNNESFKNNFIENIKSLTNLEALKKSFETLDHNNNGRLTKADFCSIIQKYSKEFKDEDIMKFTRISNLVDNNNLVKYNDFLLLLFYDAKSDLFNLCIEELKKYLIESCKKDLTVFFQIMNHMEKNSIYDVKKTVTVDQMYDFLKQRIQNLPRNVVCKFDLDSDGLISYNDIEGIFERYLSTSFFKFDNTMNTPDNNLYAYEEMSEEKFKSIVVQIKKNMKKKNITVNGLFKKLDINGDGFISNYEFNNRIDDIIMLSSPIKDQFFNYLDYYHNGLVDMNTFLKRFKEFKSTDVLIKNNNKTEVEIFDALIDFLKKNNTILSDTEIFSLIDKNCDGLIDLADFKEFCYEQLKFIKDELNDYKLQRVIQTLSLTKNNNISLADLKEIINKVVIGNNYVNFIEKFKETINQNLYKNKENVDWTNDVIEKFGLFIGERYASVDEFFEENTVKNSGKFTFEDFEKFHRINYQCFEGFNLTPDELLAVYTTLDSQKKNYLTIQDFKTKLKIFDFYKKMHFDIKNFIKQNFNNAVDAFKFFITDLNKDNVISKKDFFDTINKFFPKKYLTETILKYAKLNFKNPEQIPFSEFNYIYFDKINYDDNFDKNKNERTRLTTTRQRPKSAAINPNSRLCGKLQTPYDYDALTKLRRIIDSTPQNNYNNYFGMYNSLSTNGFINKFEFRNMIKGLNVGLTAKEIDEIISKVGMTRAGQVNLKEFIKFISSKEKTIVQSKENMSAFIIDLKQLINKYYSSPKLAFQFNDLDKSNYIDFSEYKIMVCNLFNKESKPQPNFAILKNSFDALDLRKDGIIDLNEWNKAFADYRASLDINADQKQMKQIRQWESSNNVNDIYVALFKNKNLVKQYAKPFFISSENGVNLIQYDNFISVLKQVVPRVNISSTQWRMIIKIAERERTGLIDYNSFMSTVEKSARITLRQPKFK